MRRLVEFMRWLISLTLTVAFIAAMPLALLVAPSPLDPDRGVGALVRALVEDRQIFDESVISVFVAICWVLWAAFVVGFALEAVAAIGGRPSRTVTGLGVMQKLARKLVAGLMWSSTMTSLAGSALGAGALTVITAETAAAQTQTPPETTNDSQTQQFRSSNDTGRTQSGHGSSSHELVVELNNEFDPFANGTAPVAVVTHVVDETPAAVQFQVVEAGHTMWDLADEHLGDPLRWVELWRLNENQPQPDGLAPITDPDMIHPGQILQFPTDATGLDAIDTAQHNTTTISATNSSEQPSQDTTATTVLHLEVEPAAIAAATANLSLVEQIPVSEPGSGAPPLATMAGSADEVSTVPGSAGEVSESAAASDEEGSGIDSSTSEPVNSSTSSEVAEDAGRVGSGDTGLAEDLVGSGEMVELLRPPAGIFAAEISTDGEPVSGDPAATVDSLAIPPAPAVGAGEGVSDLAKQRDGQDLSASDENIAGDSSTRPQVPVPVGERAIPGSAEAVSAEDLARESDPAVIRSINWSTIVAGLPLLAGGIWFLLRRRNVKRAARRQSRYSPAAPSDAEAGLAAALACEPESLGSTEAIWALSNRLSEWLPLECPPLVAVTTSDTEVALLWDAPQAPEPLADTGIVSCDGATWRISVEDLAAVPLPLGFGAAPVLPSLVSVGQLDSGRHLYLCLEEARRVSVDAESAQDIERFCSRLAIEFATSPLAEFVGLVLVGFGERIASINNGSASIEYYPDAKTAFDAKRHYIEVLEADLGERSALQHRAAQRGSDVDPIVMISADPNIPVELAELADRQSGGLCLVHPQIAHVAASNWPISLIDDDRLHVGGNIDKTVALVCPDDDAIAAVAAWIDEPVDYVADNDTIEGAISDHLADLDLDQIAHQVALEHQPTTDQPHTSPAGAAEPAYQDRDLEKESGVETDQNLAVWSPETDERIVVWTPEADDAQGSVDTSEALGEAPEAPWSDRDDTVERVAESEPVVASAGVVAEPIPMGAGVRLRVLGDVRVEGAELSGRLTELLALMVVHGHRITASQINMHMFGGDASQTAPNRLLGRLRSALGTADDGQPRLSTMTAIGNYELHDVTSDLDQVLAVCAEVRANPSMGHAQACAAMDSAVQLITGEPFAGAGTKYQWVVVEGTLTSAVSTADKLCRELGEVYRTLGNHDRAGWAIRQGLKACRPCDDLYLALIHILEEQASSVELAALWQEIERSYDAKGVEVPNTLAQVHADAVAAVSAARHSAA